MDGWDWIGKATELRLKDQPFALVTVIESKGSVPRKPGAKMLVELTGDFQGTIGGGRLEELVIEDARKALADAVSAPRKYPLCFRTGQCCGGAVEVFIEIMGVTPVLYLFGGGHVGQALCQTLVGTPFAVHLIDERPEWIQHAGVPVGVVKVEKPWQQFVEGATWDAQRTYVAVMTHDHARDLEIVRAVVERPARFLGLIGSRTKWERFQQRLAGLGVSEVKVSRVRCPIGLPLGGKAPREIAISVAAQLLSMHYGDDA